MYLMVQPFFLLLTRREKPKFIKRYLFAVSVVLIASISHIFLNFSLEDNITYIIFTLAVVISAWYGGLGAGLFAIFLYFLAGLFFPFRAGPGIDLRDNRIQLHLVFFAVQGVIISFLSEMAQEATRWQSIILESISDAFITYDRNMRFMYVNRQAERLLQIPRKRLVGKRLVDLYPEAKKTFFYKQVRESLTKQKKMQFELYIPDDERYFDISLYPSLDGVSCYYKDITRRKRIEKRLRETQLQFKRLFDANIIGMLIADLDGTIYEANDSFLSLIQYTREELDAGKINWKRITPPEYQAISNTSNAEVLRRGMSEPFVKEYIRHDGSRVHVLVGKVLLNRRTKRILAFCLNVSEQIALEQKKNEFISIASHELKTPLTTIKAFTQLLLKQMHAVHDKRSLHFLQNIDSQVNKLNALIGDLMDVSKIESGKLQFSLKEIAISELIKKVVTDYQYTTQSHTIIIKGSCRKKIFGDYHRLEQVLINLISNAVKYSPNAKEVIVRITEQARDVIISVQDFGIGISEVEQRRVFDRFFRSEHPTVAQIGGFGLGLYITKEIIDRHQGKIWVKSQVGKGSTFFVSLPLYNKTRRERIPPTKITSAL